MGKAYGVILVYSLTDKTKVISDFCKYVSFLAKGEHKVLVVENNNTSSFDYRKLGVEQIVGDNSLWEFSGWKNGIEILKSRYELLDDDVFIFANDTFNNHRFFSLMDVFLYRRSISSLFNTKTAIVGEKCTVPSRMVIDSITFDSWISTYFFIVNRSTLDLLLKSIFDEHKVIEYVNENEISFESPLISESLSSHINMWLRPKSNTHSWYKSSTSDLQLIEHKTKAIINEKYLSASCINNNGILLGVYSTWYGRLIKKVNNKIYSWRK